MYRLIDYIVEKQHEDIELTLTVKYAKNVGWTILLNKLGYDMPLVYVKESSEKEVFDKAYEELKEKLDEPIK